MIHSNLISIEITFCFVLFCFSMCYFTRTETMVAARHLHIEWQKEESREYFAYLTSMFGQTKIYRKTGHHNSTPIRQNEKRCVISIESLIGPFVKMMTFKAPNLNFTWKWIIFPEEKFDKLQISVTDSHKNIFFFVLFCFISSPMLSITT